MTERNPSGPRCAALAGPYLSGKTSLLESIMFITGAIPRKGSAKDGNTVGDSSPEARARQMSVEVSIGTTEYLGESWTFLDCPGSIELLQESMNALSVADVAVIVCEPLVERAHAVASLFRLLNERDIPHMVYINKMDHASAAVADIVAALQKVSDKPLVLRQVPIANGEAVSGYVDLASERSFKYKPGEASEKVDIPDSAQDMEQEARQQMLESLADFDDTLLEQLLEDVVPPTEEVYGYLTQNLQAGHIVPVFMGAAEQDHGVRRLLKALRHEGPDVSATLDRLGRGADSGEPLGRVFKTYYVPHTGKQSLVRVLRGEISDGATFNGGRVGGVFRLMGQNQTKLGKAAAGEVVALGRMDSVVTGALLTPSGKAMGNGTEGTDLLSPVYAMAVGAENRGDEVKLSEAISKLVEEDPSLVVEQNTDTQEMVLWGQGEIQLQIAVDRLKNKYNLVVTMRRPQVPYKETIRKPVSQHARHKKQTGGHGQFGDVKVDINPQPRGEGFSFNNTVVGGNVPRQFIPSVERGVNDYLHRGPLGFPVVDVSVTLTDGQHHSVDSSDQAFRTAGRLAMSEGMPKCDPVLLEPILKVTILTPNEFTPNAQRLITGRRGQILGFEPKNGWKGWDAVSAYMPQNEVHDLIVELRSITVGVGTFEWEFDHLQELSGRLADDVIKHRAEAQSAS